MQAFPKCFTYTHKNTYKRIANVSYKHMKTDIHNVHTCMHAPSACNIYMHACFFVNLPMHVYMNLPTVFGIVKNQQISSSKFFPSPKMANYSTSVGQI